MKKDMFTDFLLCLFFEGVISQHDYNFQHEFIQRPIQTAYYQEYGGNGYNWQIEDSRFSEARRNFPGRDRLRFPEYIESEFEYIPKEAKCRCSCKRCEELKPCCRSVCVNCYSDQGLVVVPYPVPLIVHVSSAKTDTTSNDTATTTTLTTTTTTTTTTTSTTTKTIKPTEIIETRGQQKSTIPVIAPAFTESNMKYKKCPLNSNCLHETQIHRRNDLHHNTDGPSRIYHDLGIIRPTVSNLNYRLKNKEFNWIPKYGIMPIPNEIAMKLMEDSRNFEP